MPHHPRKPKIITVSVLLAGQQARRIRDHLVRAQRRQITIIMLTAREEDTIITEEQVVMDTGTIPQDQPQVQPIAVNPICQTASNTTKVRTKTQVIAS